MLLFTFCYFDYLVLAEDNFTGLFALASVITSGTFLCIALPLSVYSIIQLFRIRQTTYICHNCKNKFYSGIVIETRDVEFLIADIKKPHLAAKRHS